MERGISIFPSLQTIFLINYKHTINKNTNIRHSLAQVERADRL